jgi:hypothetical protein
MTGNNIDDIYLSPSAAERAGRAMVSQGLIAAFRIVQRRRLAADRSADIGWIVVAAHRPRSYTAAVAA